MEKKLILAIALSIFVIVTFQYLVVKPAPKPEAVKISNERAQPIVTAKEAEIKSYVPQKTLSEEKEFNVETDRHILTFSNVGGSIKRIRLKDHKSLNSNEPLDLVEIPNPKEYIFL